MLLASILGMLIVTFIVFFILVSSVSFGEPVVIKNNSILTVSLHKPLKDYAGVPSIDPISFTIESNLGLNSVIWGIGRAKNDSRIKGIYLDLTVINGGIASIQEIRNALIDFKQSGKYIIAYAESYTQKAYYLATVADKIYLNPFGSVDFKGMSSTVTFYKGLFDKLGIDMQIIRHGKFKSAIEPFTLTKMSDENREQIKTYMGSIWNHILQAISASRNISVEDLNNIADNLGLSFANDALDKNFVDKLMSENEVIEELKKYTGEQTLNTVSISQYYIPLPVDKKGDKIAVIYASGEIISGDGDTEVMSANMVRAIKTARSDSTVKAVVLRVNSPGGSALASDVIARELEITKRNKPVVISMGDVAASGGYWISAPGQKIFAQHTTLTGSIGVFGIIPNIQKTLEDKIGITTDVVKTNENADFPAITRPLRPAERNYLQKSVENVYSVFISNVGKSRNMTTEMVDSIGQGRVWSGSNAYDLGLIDYFGGMKDAIEEAAKMANITNYTLLELPKELSTIEMLMKSFEAKISGSVNNELVNTLKHYEFVTNTIKNYGVVAKMPYNMEIE